MKEINKKLGGKYLFRKESSRGFNEPSKIIAYNRPFMTAAFGFSAGLASYAKFGKGYSVIWLVGGFMPFVSCAFYNYFRQPEPIIQNAYNYILAKRSATVDYE